MIGIEEAEDCAIGLLAAAVLEDAHVSVMRNQGAHLFGEFNRAVVRVVV